MLRKSNARIAEITIYGKYRRVSHECTNEEIASYSYILGLLLLLKSRRRHDEVRMAFVVVLTLSLFMDPMLATFDNSFRRLDARSRELLSSLIKAQLFEKPRNIPNSMAMFSVGEYILRSAAMVEKTFGGITARLWDDPFEWTLPEKLADKAGITQYLDEVEVTRAKGFAFFASDDDLKRQMPAPEKLRSVFEILLETLAIGEHFQGRAFAVFQMLSDEKLPRR